MRQAIGRYSKDFVAIIVLLLIGLATLFVILSQQASALPSWFPLLGEERFELEAEFQTAQAVTPGQGQSVNMAGRQDRRRHRRRARGRCRRRLAATSTPSTRR